jgi:hypothetical protein
MHSIRLSSQDQVGCRLSCVFGFRRGSREQLVVSIDINEAVPLSLSAFNDDMEALDRLNDVTLSSCISTGEDAAD